jgi:hypothetical protein
MSGWTPPPEEAYGLPRHPAAAARIEEEPEDEPGRPVRPRPAMRQRLAITAGVVIAVIIVAGVFVFALSKKTRWTLGAPPTVAGLSRDAAPPGQLGLGALVTRFRSDVTSLPDYGSLTSTVSAVYALGASQAVGFIGFNGSFNVRVALKDGPGLDVSSVSPGPHGGTAECGTSGQEAICQWSTSTTVGFVVVVPATAESVPEPASSAARLMLRIRDDVERRVGHG